MLHGFEVSKGVVDGAGKFISGYIICVYKRKRIEDTFIGNVFYRFEGPVSGGDEAE